MEQRDVLLVGSGAREHAIADALTREGNAELHAAMQVVNPGILALSRTTHPSESDAQGITAFGRSAGADFAVVGPEKPLEAGLVDALEEAGIPCASPTRGAARIETNKIFMRQLLGRYGIPGQVEHLETSLLSQALAFCEQHQWQVAVKPIGLTSGKGVRVWGDHLHTPEEVKQYITQVLRTRMSGYDEVLIEELLRGQEYTIHFFSDGTHAVASPAVQDHKRAFDGDQGPNTGGMGSYSDANGRLPFLSQQEYETSVSIGQQVIAALNEEGVPFKGVLYGQFMLTAKGPQIVEINARFGDPEAINTLMVLRSNYADLCMAMIHGGIREDMASFDDKATVVQYVVPQGYGSAPRAGEDVLIDEPVIREIGASIFYASCNLLGAAKGKTRVRTTASRTLALAATGSSLEDARKRTMEALQFVTGNVFHRTDIASEESLRAKVAQIQALRGSR
ncbi:MAG: phosphoribosylamine--glycine ligase [Candidatus Peribacteraceae bacterium]|nr:phosphoribosylamine--glycine ligase [Candidatus Peribacteraceae bacterium]MDD5075070.1 phosphoribosylamine--glycine ligase [Candidatus Peribacteraceae bacterium]